MNQRIDWLMRQHVDQGLDLAANQGVYNAAAFMYSKGVPLHVAKRVLLAKAF